MILSELDRKRRTMVTCSIIELVDMYRNGQIATREINQLRVRSIKNYLLDNALTKISTCRRLLPTAGKEPPLMEILPNYRSSTEHNE
ncbi:hypothetical protein Q5O89_20635 [Peribacillus frigoritolerans]|nr:hypothetical protein [Peribacillus frigoritolerans]